MARFFASWHKFSGVYECRVTSLIEARSLSPVTNLMAGTGAVSRYKLRSKLGIYQVTQSLLRALERSQGGAFKGSRYKKAVSSKTVTNK